MRIFEAGCLVCVRKVINEVGRILSTYCQVALFRVLIFLPFSMKHEFKTLANTICYIFSPISSIAKRRKYKKTREIAPNQ